MNPQPLNVLVVGAGMYVCGSGTDGFGTILPTLVQEQHRGSVAEIHIAATRPESALLLQEKLKALNERMGVNGRVHTYPGGGKIDTQAYKRALEVLPRPAAAIVSVPDHLHAVVSGDVIRAGVHPLVVKPLTPTAAEARELIRLLDHHHVYGAVEFHKRFDEANLLLRQKIREGRLGDLCYAVVEFSQRRSIREVFHSWVSRTNIFQYLGVHYADLIYFATGARPLRAMAVGQVHATVGKEPGKPVYDAVQAVAEWEMPVSGKRFTSTILTNWIDPDTTSAMSDQKITIVGTAGRCRSDQKNRGFQMVTTDEGIEDINPYFTQLYADNENKLRVHGYGPQSVRQFLADAAKLAAGAVTKEELELNRPTFRQALVSTAVVEAVNLSLTKGGRWVSIDEYKG